MTVVPRVRCVVPFCQHTTRNDRGYIEWICRDHWRGVDRRTRRWHRVAALRLEAIQGWQEYWKLNPGSVDRVNARRLHQLELRLWGRCKKQAIERAAGIR